MNEHCSADDWLLIDIDGENVHFGTAQPVSHTYIANERTYKSADFATLTDCIIDYARTTGVSIERRKSALVVSGAVGADSVRIARSRWIISKAGIEMLVGAKPVFINDSVARAWSCLGAAGTQSRMVGGTGYPNFDQVGKWAVVNFATGLGAACLHITEHGQTFVTDSEGGHLGFAPQNELEREIATLMAKSNSRVTYERMLFIDRTDPLWSQLSRPVDNSERDSIRAAIFGSFVGDVVLTFASWSGVFVSGEQSEMLTNPTLADIFNKRYEDKGHFRLNVRGATRWIAAKTHNNLQGAARMMAVLYPSNNG